MAESNVFGRGAGIVTQTLHTLVSQIPRSDEFTSATPDQRAAELARRAALKAAAFSGSLSLPFGPLGLTTVLPDLLAVWRIQQQLVADIAAAYGRPVALTPETMVYCLFHHGGALLSRRLFSRNGDDVHVHRISHRTLHQLLEKIAIRLTQRLAAKSVSRWVPIVGAVGAGAYAFYDTRQVAKNAIGLFSANVRIDDPVTTTIFDHVNTIDV